MKVRAKTIPFVALVACAGAAILALSACGSQSGTPASKTQTKSTSAVKVAVVKTVKAVAPLLPVGKIEFATPAYKKATHSYDSLHVEKWHVSTSGLSTTKPVAWIANVGASHDGTVLITVTRISGLGTHPATVILRHERVNGLLIHDELTPSQMQAAHIGAGGYRVDYKSGARVLSSGIFKVRGGPGSPSPPY